MLKLEKRFNMFRKAHPYNGDYIIMCMTVRGQNYEKSLISRAFKRLVSDEEYTKEDKAELMDYLILQTSLKENE